MGAHGKGCGLVHMSRGVKKSLQAPFSSLLRFFIRKSFHKKEHHKNESSLPRHSGLTVIYVLPNLLHRNHPSLMEHSTPLHPRPDG